MHWYGGSIAEAVTLSKQRNAIFVVFVEGDNDLSVEMASTLEDAAVLKRLSDQSNFLAVKLKSGSTNYTHFAQIYQFVPVPSLFFIGRNGTPLEVVCAGVQASNLAERIDRILQEHNKEQPSVQPSTSSQNVKQQTVNLLQSEATANQPTPTPPPASVPVPAPAPAPGPVSRPVPTPASTSSSSSPTKQKVDEEPETSSGPAAKIQKTEHHEVTKSGQEYDVVCDGDVCVRRPRANADQPGPSQQPRDTAENITNADQELRDAISADHSSVSVEEKMERAKALIEARRREKAQKEKELEKQKELERRTTGQGIVELKRWQADQELKQIQEERKREKMENNLARQRILEQIAQDRAERRARDAPPPPPPAQPAHAPQATPATSGDAGSRARIQFKLPDGTSHTAHFDAEGTLSEVRRYVADNLQLSATAFSLWIAFPRRELTESDETLRRLQLAPSAALLVLPRRAPAAVAAPSPLANVIAYFTEFITSFILQPSHQLYEWIRSRLFPPAAPADRAPAPATPPPPQPPPGARRRGNIHRLPGERPGNDDNNTWNGNSTQQM